MSFHCISSAHESELRSTKFNTLKDTALLGGSQQIFNNNSEVITVNDLNELVMEPEIVN